MYTHLYQSNAFPDSLSSGNIIIIIPFTKCQSNLTVYRWYMYTCTVLFIWSVFTITGPITKPVGVDTLRVVTSELIRETRVCGGNNIDLELELDLGRYGHKCGRKRDSMCTSCPGPWQDVAQLHVVSMPVYRFGGLEFESTPNNLVLFSTEVTLLGSSVSADAWMFTATLSGIRYEYREKERAGTDIWW